MRCPQGVGDWNSFCWPRMSVAAGMCPKRPGLPSCCWSSLILWSCSHRGFQGCSPGIAADGCHLLQQKAASSNLRPFRSRVCPNLSKLNTFLMQTIGIFSSIKLWASSKQAQVLSAKSPQGGRRPADQSCQGGWGPLHVSPLCL